MEAASGLQVGDLVYIPGHVMMVIGHDNGMPYVIHDTNGGSWLGPDGTLVRGRLNGVSVTPLTPLRSHATQTYLHRTTHTPRHPPSHRPPPHNPTPRHPPTPTHAHPPPPPPTPPPPPPPRPPPPH